MDAGFRDKWRNNWTDAVREGRRGFTVDQLVTPGCSTSWNAVFLSFCLC